MVNLIFEIVVLSINRLCIHMYCAPSDKVVLEYRTNLFCFNDSELSLFFYYLTVYKKNENIWRLFVKKSLVMFLIGVGLGIVVAV